MGVGYVCVRCGCRCCRSSRRMTAEGAIIVEKWRRRRGRRLRGNDGDVITGTKPVVVRGDDTYADGAHNGDGVALALRVRHPGNRVLLEGRHLPRGGRSTRSTTQLSAVRWLLTRPQRQHNHNNKSYHRIASAAGRTAASGKTTPISAGETLNSQVEVLSENGSAKGA